MNRTRGGLGTFDAGSGLLQQASVLFQNIVNAIDANFPANEQQQRISVSLAASVLRLEIRRYRLGRKKGEDYKDELSLNPSRSTERASLRERERGVERRVPHLWLRWLLETGPQARQVGAAQPHLFPPR